MIDEIEIEAWISGFMPWLRELTGRAGKPVSENRES
jgi:hypothetical protein